MTIDELNAMDRRAFVDALGWIFEDSPWVAERTWPKRPFASRDHLHEAMMAEVSAAAVEERLALLRAHPDLGKKLQSDTQMSAASVREQSGAGLDALLPDELARLHALNDAYRQKFGFPFLFAVKGSTKHDILSALERRLPLERDAEQREALRQVSRIAQFRLEELIA